MKTGLAKPSVTLSAAKRCPTAWDIVSSMHPHLLPSLQAFLDSEATELILDSAAFDGSHLSLSPAMQSNALPVNASLHGMAQQLYERNTYLYALTVLSVQMENAQDDLWFGLILCELPFDVQGYSYVTQAERIILKRLLHLFTEPSIMRPTLCMLHWDS